VVNLHWIYNLLWAEKGVVGIWELIEKKRKNSLMEGEWENS
jgi:hypothetical protein